MKLRVLAVVALVALGACSSSTQQQTPQRFAPPPEQTKGTVVVEAPPPEPPAPSDGVRCVIREKGAHLAAPLALRVHGKRFAILRDVGELELRNTTANVTVGDLTLKGDVDLKKQQLRSKTSKGWLVIRAATGGTIADDKLVLDFKLPSTVTTATAPLVSVPCSEVTLTEAPPLPAEGTAATLKASSKFSLRAEPTGPVVATIETPQGANEFEQAALEAHELARKGQLVKIRTGTTNYVEGWIDAANVAPATMLPAVRMQTPEGRSATMPQTVRCAREVNIYVRDPELILVGVYKPGAPIAKRETRDDDVIVDLGLPPKVEPMEPQLEPFVRASALTACQ